MDSASGRSSVDDIVARLERLPTSWWQVKARIIVGVATFFDAFDALAIASILPVIVPLWKLTPPQIGLMISAGFLGQLLGALLFGWIAERYGRMTAMIWSIALFGIMSLMCALAWDYNSLLLFRTIQGIGLGGEVPVAAVFISELAKAQGRGRFVLLYELVFPIGLVAASLVGLWVVPHLGWQYMFVIGALPALLTLALRSLLPESPRWLAVRGRDAEAQAAMTLIEMETQKATGQPLPPPKPVGLHVRQASVACRPVRPALLTAHAGRLGDLVLIVFRQLWPLDLAADGLSNGVQAAAGRFTAIRIDHTGCRALGNPDLRPSHRSCRPPPVVCIVIRGCGNRAGRARAVPGPHCGTGAGLHDGRLFLHQHHQYWRLPLHSRTLSDPRARARGRGGHRLASVCLHDRAHRGRDDAGWRLAVGLRHVRHRRGDCCRDHRSVRHRDQGPRPRGGFALAVPVIARGAVRGDNSTSTPPLPRPPALCNLASKSAEKPGKPSPGGNSCAS